MPPPALVGRPIKCKGESERTEPPPQAVPPLHPGLGRVLEDHDRDVEPRHLGPRVAEAEAEQAISSLRVGAYADDRRVLGGAPIQATPRVVCGLSVERLRFGGILLPRGQGPAIGQIELWAANGDGEHRRYVEELATAGLDVVGG